MLNVRVELEPQPEPHRDSAPVLWHHYCKMMPVTCAFCYIEEESKELTSKNLSSSLMPIFWIKLLAIDMCIQIYITVYDT
jgi:hypothetical protein